MSIYSPDFNVTLRRRAASLENVVDSQISHFFRLSKHLASHRPSVANHNTVQYDSPWLGVESGNNEETKFLASKALFSRKPLRPRIGELYKPRTKPPQLGYRECIFHFDAETKTITAPSPTGDIAVLPESDEWKDLYTKLDRLEDIRFTTIIGHIATQRQRPDFDPRSPREYYGYQP